MAHDAFGVCANDKGGAGSFFHLHSKNNLDPAHFLNEHEDTPHRCALNPQWRYRPSLGMRFGEFRFVDIAACGKSKLVRDEPGKEVCMLVSEHADAHLFLFALDGIGRTETLCLFLCNDATSASRRLVVPGRLRPL